MKLRIVEHISGVWSYHLAEEGKYKSICPRQVQVMNTSFKGLASWGDRCGNKLINYKWCKECEALKGLTT